MKVIYRIACSILVFSFTTLGGLAQTTSTPTPAPSKTPTVDPASETVTDELATPAADRPMIDPFTQSDLTVLTGNVQRPNGAVWFNDNIYMVCNGDWTLYELHDTTGSTRTYIYGVRNGHTVLVDENTSEFTLWVPDYELNALLRVNPARAPQQVAVGLESPWGITYFDEEHFLVTNLAGNNLVMVGQDGEIETLVEGLRAPTGIAAGNTSVYIANNGSARRSIEWVERDSLTSSEEVVLQPLVSGLQNVTGLVLAEDGYLYFAYAIGTRGVVGRVDPVQCQEQGGCSNDEVEIVLYTELAAPLAGLTISPDMRLFVHTIYRPEIYWVQLGSTSSAN